MKWILLLVLFGCATGYQLPEKAPEVVAKPVEVPVSLEKPAATEVVVEKPVEVTVPLPVQPKREVFSTTSTLAYMKEVAKISNCIINTEAFLKEVELFPKFTFTDKTSKQVAESLRSAKPVVLSTYRTKNPFSSAIATTFADDPIVYFNTRANPRDMPSMVNTSLHEGLHLNGWSHGDNSPVGKDDSVNYRVGSMAEKYAKACGSL